MRRGFTMIELIFVIVIIGILAAVAIPKLAATRDDALDTRDCNNVATCVKDLVGMYTGSQQIDKSKSPACVGAEASNKNSISIDINSTGKTLRVTGAPKLCEDMNREFLYGGMRVKF